MMSSAAALQLFSFPSCLCLSFGSAEPSAAVRASAGPLIAQFGDKEGVTMVHKGNEPISDFAGVVIRLNKPAGAHHSTVRVGLKALVKIPVSVGKGQFVRNSVSSHGGAGCREERKTPRYRATHGQAKLVCLELDGGHIKGIKAWLCSLAARMGSLEREAV